VVDQVCDEVRRKVVGCPRCGECTFVEPGPQPQLLACKRCQAPISVASEDGRLPAPARAEQQTLDDPSAEEATLAIPPASPAAFGASPTADLSGEPGGFGMAPSAGFGASPSSEGPRPDGMPEAVGEWTIEREIGRGGMGVIYLARHRTSGEKA